MSLWSRLVNVIRGDRLIAEIDEELESHIAEAIAHGRDAEEARRAFGGSLRQREASRDTKTHGVARRLPDGPTTSRPCRMAPPGPHKRGRWVARARHGRQYRDFFAQQQSDPEVPARRAQRPAGSSDTGRRVRSLDLSTLGTTSGAPSRSRRRLCLVESEREF